MHGCAARLIAVAVTIACGGSSAHATACCEVLRTRDGFVALRKTPDASAPLILKVPTGRDICFGTERPKIAHPPNWDYGFHADAAGTMHWGWVNKRLLSKQCG